MRTTVEIKREYTRWLKNAHALTAELSNMDNGDIEDAFYRDLAFGTGGLRGTIGAGTNRMNEYVVAKASQGLANYLLSKSSSPSAVIGYDSRIKSNVFAKVAAGVFAANGIIVHIWPELLPVPTVSYAVRALHTDAGIMITASHNPAKYNGYKVYGPDGCQITTEAADAILSKIEPIDIFDGVKSVDYDSAFAAGMIKQIPETVLTEYIEEVKRQSVLFGDHINRDTAIVYSPLNGEMNVIHSAWLNGCKKLEFLGSSCIYPRMAPQPMSESCLLTSALEETNEAYALAKISGLKYCEYLNAQYGTDYISVMPTNLYGPNDNYHPTHSHVLPALIRRFHEAKIEGRDTVTCWGDGSPLREFLYVDDLANLCVFLMNNYSGNETVNAGTGKELTIKELTELVAKVVGYTGRIEWDPTKPNGTPRKLLDVSKATKLGWTYKTELEDGIRLSYQDFLNNPMRAER